jgi:hypothetical protein
MKPVNREMLIRWVESFKSQNKDDEMGVLDFKTQLLWRLNDEELFPVGQRTRRIFEGRNIKTHKDILEEIKEHLKGILDGDIPCGEHEQSISSYAAVLAYIEALERYVETPKK